LRTEDKSSKESPIKCVMDDFRRFHFAVGEEILRIEFEHELKGFLETAAEQSVEVMSGLSASAVSSGAMDASAWEELLQLFRERSQLASEADGAYLALHASSAASESRHALLLISIRSRL